MKTFDIYRKKHSLTPSRWFQTKMQPKFIPPVLKKSYKKYLQDPFAQSPEMTREEYWRAEEEKQLKFFEELDQKEKHEMKLSLNDEVQLQFRKKMERLNKKLIA